MQELISEVTANVILALIGLVSAYIIFLIKKATNKISLEIDKLNDEKDKHMLRMAQNSLEEIAIKTVASIEQTSAKAIRSAVKDGRIDRDELVKLSKNAYEEIVGILKPEYINVLENNVNNIEQYILNTIEQKVLEIKNQDYKIGG